MLRNNEGEIFFDMEKDETLIVNLFFDPEAECNLCQEDWSITAFGELDKP